ncbi:MAG: anaerobic ribonucleoside-triphosphate reductase activating protein [Clostridiales bacterium]|nr:anaerobic ribonucleoside-triphosphate reductase activating protein [Clostridiales bacterium]
MLQRNFGNTAVIEELPIRLFGVARESIVDGPQLRYVVFVQGCPHKCAGCHNPGSHAYGGGKVTTTTRLWNDITKNPLIKGLTFSGGEPFLWGHELAVVAKKAIESGMDIMTYSGFTYEHLLEKAKTEPSVHELLSVTNYLVDGRYVDSLRDLNLHFRGSSNQRILDITCYPNSTQAVQVEL